MNSIRLSILLLCILTQAICLIACSDTGGSGSGKIQAFYSAEEPGRWEAQAVDHEVNAVIIEDMKHGRVIEVSVPFTKEMNEQHYVEAIVLLDEKNRELAKKTFNRGEKAHAVFEITGKIKFPVYVVSKCNMHEMWRKKIEGNEKSRENRK